MKPWIKTNLGAMILSITLVGCGGGQDPEVSGTAAKTALGITSVQTAPAAIQFEVVSLGKVAEKRISRSVTITRIRCPSATMASPKRPMYSPNCWPYHWNHNHRWRGVGR
jgi:hypothetical protein